MAAPTSDTLEVSASVSDLDGDRLTVTYDWYVDATLVQSGSADTLEGASLFDRGEIVSVVITADDESTTTTVTPDPFTVSNSPPPAPTISITPRRADDQPGRPPLSAGQHAGRRGWGHHQLHHLLGSGRHRLDRKHPPHRRGWRHDLSGRHPRRRGVDLHGEASDSVEDGEAVSTSVTIEERAPKPLSLSAADYHLIGENAGDLAGYSVAGAGDVDDDGLQDILISAPDNDDVGSMAGKAYLIFGQE